MTTASKLFISTFGTFIGLMGFEHGLGEIQQGSVPTPGLFFPSWPDSPFFAVQAGEPAFSVLPDMLVTGILASVFSLAYVTWSLFFPDHRHSRSVMMVLAGFMFLTGAGIFPPLFALIIGWLSNRLHTSPSGWRRPAPVTLIPIFAKLWPWLFGLCLACWVSMFPVIPSLEYFFGYSNDTIFYCVLSGMILFLVLANLAGKARDFQASSQI